MLSDALSEARANICHYLTDDLYSDWYGKAGGPLYDRVFRLLVEMSSIQFELDASCHGKDALWHNLRYEQQVEYVKQELAEAKAHAEYAAEERRNNQQREAMPL